MNVSPRLQRGAAFLVLVGIISALSIVFVVGQAAWLSKERANQLPQLQAHRVAQAAAAIRDWYSANSAMLDTPTASPPEGAELLAEIGVPRQWLLQAAISAPQVRGQIRYRVIAIWAETDDPQVPVFDASNAVLNLCPNASLPCIERAAARVEGYELQAAQYASSVESMRALARSAQAYFQARFMADPDHNLTVNYFRAPMDPIGCTSAAEDIECLDGWTDIGATQVLRVLGEPTSRGLDAWGRSIEIANGNAPSSMEPLGAAAATPPYRLALRTITPWGEPIVIFAVQRL